MEATKNPPGPERGNGRRARLVFFSWFFALFGLGAAMLALLLIATGELRWSSPMGLLLLGLSALGIVCLVTALGGLLRARGEGPGS